MMKPGRNDKCPCGSGKKFKKCHIDNIPLLMSEIMQRASRPEYIDENGQLIGRPIIATHFKDKRVVAVGSRLYHSLPTNITFQEFLITFLKDTVGQVWGKNESEKPKEERHIIVQWIAEMAKLIGSSKNVVMEDPEHELKSAPASGNVQALLSLAYDVYSVYHCTDLPEELVERLKNMDQFQGAKYEIAVAAIFARAGFDIKWLEKTGEKICEFIATHKQSKESILVEAKSRHRQGVLGRPGQRGELADMRSQVGRLFNQALEKPTNGLAYMIFIDINLPLTPGDNDLNKRWIRDIKKMLDQHPIGTEKKPDLFSSLFITNFSWHYIGEDVNTYKGENVTIVPMYPIKRVQTPGLIDLLHQATLQYGAVPPLFPEDSN